MAPTHIPALDSLREHLDEIVGEITAKLLGSAPSFAGMPAGFKGELEGLVRVAMQALIRLLENGGAAVEPIAWGNLMSFELADLLRALQVGSEVAWGRVKKAFEESGPPSEASVSAAEAIWNLHFRVANSLAREYMRQRQRFVGEFNQLLNHIRSTQDREELLRMASQGICEKLGYRRAVLFIAEEDCLVPLSATDRADPDWGARVIAERRRYPISPLSGSLESRAFQGTSVVVQRAGSGGSIALLQPEEDVWFALVPVKAAASWKGLLYVEADVGSRPIGDREAEMLSSYADVVGMALENERLYREVVAKGNAMEHLMSRVNSATEEERARIARELHDSVAQSLLKIIYAAGFALDFLKEDPRLAVEEIEEVQQRAKECLRELRLIMADLRPTSLDILGLKETVLRYAEQFEEEYAISIKVDLRGLDSIPTPVELAVFRILQEELSNVRKHANADSVYIKSERDQGGLVLVVEDDGMGFDPETLAEKQESGKHLGLMAVRERAEMLGGEMAIDSTPGMGTRITVRLPMVAGGEG